LLEGRLRLDEHGPEHQAMQAGDGEPPSDQALFAGERAREKEGRQKSARGERLIKCAHGFGQQVLFLPAMIGPGGASHQHGYIGTFGDPERLPLGVGLH
jgi:hypothetical protein